MRFIKTRYLWPYALLILLFSYKAFAFCWSCPFYKYPENRKFLQSLKERDLGIAHMQLISFLKKNPLNPIVHMNLAFVLAKSGKSEEAKRAYQSVLESLSPSSEMKFHIFFNLALLEAKKNRIDEALSFFQKALALRPNSHIVKNQIEFLFKKNIKNDTKNQKNSKENSSESQSKEKGMNTKSEEEKNRETSKDNHESLKENQEDSKENSQIDENSEENSLERSKNENNLNQAGDDKGNKKEGKYESLEDSQKQPQSLEDQSIEVILKLIRDKEQRIYKKKNKRKQIQGQHEKDW